MTGTGFYHKKCIFIPNLCTKHLSKLNHMKPPVNAKLIEGELATFWFDESGILCAIAKSTPRSLDKQKNNYVLVREITGNKKVCLLSDTTASAPQDKETRNYAAKEIPNFFKAMAVISDTVLGRFGANVFMALKDQPVPMQFFTNEADAKEWLKQYL